MKKKQLMGILNCTPDSFYDGGCYFDFEKAVERGLEIEKEGADILDIGGESTRPFSKRISIDEELARVIPVIAQLKKKLNIPISIETSKPEVAKKAIEAGASLINDASTLSNPQMRKLVKESKVRVCLMHIQGSPENMQIAPSYPQGVVIELLNWFNEKIHLLLDEGIQANQIIIDPGIGFGKTVQDNLTILKNLNLFSRFGAPILIGLSRKSFMQKILKKTASELLSTTLSLNTMSLQSGVDIIRVHDVKEHRDIIDMLQALDQCPSMNPSLS